MKVSRIRIQNIMGVEELEIEPGAVTVLSGKNASGKTSVLEAIRSAVSGGHDASLIRNGAEEAEVVLVLDDGTEVRKRITQAGSNLSVKHPQMGRLGKGQTWLNGLADALSFNPVEFLTCDDARRVQYVLDSAQVELDPDDLRNAVGDLLAVPAEIPGHPLRVIERVRKHLYDERTGENRTAKDSQATVGQLRASLPSDVRDPAEIEATIGRLSAEHAAVEDEQVSAQEAARRTALQQADETLTTLDEQIAELERTLAARKQERRAVAEAAEDRANVAVSQAGAPFRERLASLSGQLQALRDELRAAVSTASAAANTRSMIEQHTEKGDAAQAKADRLTRAIDNLDALKERVMAQSPIKGLDIRDGQLFWGDVTWPRVNHAQRVKLAMQLAKHRAKDLPLVCVDGLESLDPETFAAFVKAAPRSGLQFIVTRVGDEPGLTVATFGAEAEEGSVAA